MIRSLPLRGIGVGLILYGIVGLVIIAVALLVTVGAFARLDSLSDSVEGPLRSTSRTVGDASGAFGRFAVSLAEAQRSSDDAARLAGEAATTLEGLAGSIDITIFGSRPFGEAAEGFREVSEQLTALGTDLDAVSRSLGSNIVDVQRAGANLRNLRGEIDGLLAAFDRVNADQPSSTGGVRAASLALYALLLWLAIPAIASLILGVVVLRFGISRAPSARAS